MLINKASLTNFKKSVTWRRLITIIVFGLIAGGALASFAFIYKYIFQTLDDANAVVILRSSASLDLIDSASYERMKKLVETKLELPELPARVRNIFTFASIKPEASSTIEQCDQTTTTISLACSRP